MSLGHFIHEIWRTVWSFLSDRAHKEYLYLFKKGASARTVGDVERGNAYVNKIVEHLIAEKAHEYNPYIIEDKTFTWLRIPLIAEIEHLETIVEGLLSLHKEKSCMVTENCGTLNVAANLGSGPLNFTICVWGKLFQLERLIIISASLNHCKVNAAFSLNSKTGRNGRLHSLCIEEFKDLKINVGITGSRYLSWFLSKLFTLLTILSHRIIRNLVEFELEQYVRKLFPFCELPIEGNVGSLREERTVLNQVESKPLNCSNANNFKGLSFKSEQMEGSGESMKSLFMKNGYRISANSNENIYKVTDCNKEGGGKKESQLKEEQTTDSKISIEMERTFSHTNIQLLQDSEAILNHDSRTSHKFDDNIRRATKILTSEEKQSESDSKIVLKINNTNASLASECHNIPSYPKTAFDWDELQNLSRDVSCALPGDKQDISIDLEKHVESILRWTSDSEDTEESKPYDTKINNKFPNFDTKPRIQNNCSTFSKFLEKQSQISNLKKDSSKQRKVERKLSRNTDLNSNRIEKNVKNVTSNNYLTVHGENLSKSKENISCASNNQFNVIEDAICSNFGNSCSVTVPENNFFFEDNESEDFSHLEYANKQLTPEFVDPRILENKIPYLNKDVDCAMDLGHMLKPEMFLPTHNKIKQPAIQNFGLQDAASSSKYYSILKVMKNFFEQNPIENSLVEQNIPLTVSNVNSRNVSCSSHVDFSGILTENLVDSIPDACKDSHDVFEVEKFNIEPPCLSYDTVSFKGYSKHSICQGLNLSDSLSRSDSMFSEEGSFSSSSVRLDVSSENSSIFQDPTINDINECPEIARDTGKEWGTKLKLTPTNYADYADNNAKIVFDEASFWIHADVLRLLEEKSLDAELESEDSVLDEIDQITLATINLAESRRVNSTEEFQMTDNVKSLQGSSFDQDCVETLDDLSEIDNEELEYISEQTKKLKVMFEKFVEQHEIQTSACPLPYLGPTCNNLNRKLRLEDTDELKRSLSKENEFSFNIKDKFSIAESLAQDESTFEENVLVSVEEGRLFEDVTDRNMHSITNEKVHLVKEQDEQCGWFSSKKSVQSICPWEVCKILNDKGRVSWRKAMQIWGVETNTLFSPDSEYYNAQ